MRSMLIRLTCRHNDRALMGGVIGCKATEDPCSHPALGLVVICHTISTIVSISMPRVI